MPYTPPAARSPTASRPTTPKTESCQKQSEPHGHVSKPDLPQPKSSKVYLSKHRRSPSISDSNITSPFGSFANDTTVLEHKKQDGVEQPNKYFTPKDPVKPRLGTFEPSTASTTSPNASPQNSSSDDETDKRRGRVREFENLAELQAAIRNIEQHRSGSPDLNAEKEVQKTHVALGLSQSDKSDVDEKLSITGRHRPLTEEARKISHSRSSTDVTSFLSLPQNKFDARTRSASASDDEEDEDDLQIKPSLIRKKSGELVRPALRASSVRRRPSSMPGTPTYSKAVHFQDNGLEHVRHFLQVDRPIAVSAGTSPVESNFEDDNEFPFPSAFDWEIRLTNFPHDPLRQLTSPVKTEKVYLSTDTKILIGSVAVRNLAFHKLVVARFTLDYWKTTSEVVAEYSTDIKKRLLNDGLDRFVFSIKLEDQANLENKTMLFCIRYNVNGQEYWDNNNNSNYQVNFAKKFKQNSEQKGARQTNPLPWNKPTGQFSNASPSMRPRSMPSFDDFASNMAPYEFSSSPNPLSLVGDSPIRYRSKPSTAEILPDAPGKPKASSSHQAFGNRYDFGASLSAAMSAKAAATKDKIWLPPVSAAGGTVAGVAASHNQQSSIANSIPSSGSSVATGSKPAALTADKPSMQSPTYEQLLSDYCFYGSAPKASAFRLKSSHEKKDIAQTEKLHHDIPKIEPKSEKSQAPTEQRNVKPEKVEESRPSQASTPRSHTPTLEERKPSSKPASGRSSRSTSPVNPLDSRAGSPHAFGYPYHQPMQNGFFDHTPTAIRG